MPKKIEELDQVIGLSCGGMHSIAWKDDGRIYSWGYGRGFKLGQRASEEDYFSPTLIDAFAKGKIVLHVACGFERTIALLERDAITVSYKVSFFS